MATLETIYAMLAEDIAVAGFSARILQDVQPDSGLPGHSSGCLDLNLNVSAVGIRPGEHRRGRESERAGEEIAWKRRLHCVVLHHLVIVELSCKRDSVLG